MTRIFVYGTLKRGCKNHRQLADQHFVAEACTAPGYQLYDLGDFPGLVADNSSTTGVTGEVGEIDADALGRLDDFEGVADGLYQRVLVNLVAPFDRTEVFTYLYARNPGQRRIGPIWLETET